jgi:hypothetical protein
MRVGPGMQRNPGFRQPFPGGVVAGNAGRGNYGNYGSRGGRGVYEHSRGYRRAYISPYRSGIGYTVLYGPGWFGGDDADYDDSQLVPDYGPGGNVYPDDQGYPPYPAPNQGYPDQSRPMPAATYDETYTLIFKDGRAPEQIHNYVLTQSTLYVGDGHREEIPLDDLDLTATERVNRDAGVDFRVPAQPGN